MLFYTDAPEAPWTVVNSNEKKRARLEAIRHVLHVTPYDGKDETVVYVPDPRVARPASEVAQPLGTD